MGGAGSAARLLERCDELAGCSEEPGRITRPYGSAALRAARERVAGWMEETGLAVRVDALGNLIGRYEADVPDAPALLLGSHLDSVRDAGRYDGPLGVLVGLACVERLAGAGRRLRRAVEVVAFADEEGVRFLTTYLGSRAVAGTLDPAVLALVDADGVTLAEAIVEAGGDPVRISSARRDPASLVGYIEVHIEQGPVLEQLDRAVGVVTGIAGQSRAELVLEGAAGHAGTVPMALRRDALPAAAELVLETERLARAHEALVATVGSLVVEPGAPNVIPGRARLTVDVRHPQDERRRRATTALRDAAAAVAARRGVAVDWALRHDVDAVPCDARLSGALEAAAERVQGPTPRLASGAGHDAAALAALTPVAMLFVRCAGGVSHHPAESVDVRDVAVAVEVLVGAVEDLAA